MTGSTAHIPLVEKRSARKDEGQEPQVNELLKRIVQRMPLYSRLRNRLFKKRQHAELVEWERNGRPDPPPHIVKQRALRAYAEHYKLRVLVETGTYHGDMVDAMKRDFDAIYSIELSTKLFRQARRRFRRLEHVHLIQGDSAMKLGDVVRSVNQPALFWLDGHYSGGNTAKGPASTPVVAELAAILHPDMRHVIIIDDARLFGADPAYPSIEELRAFIAAKGGPVDVAVEGDSIRITPVPRGETAH